MNITTHTKPLADYRLATPADLHRAVTELLATAEHAELSLSRDDLQLVTPLAAGLKALHAATQPLTSTREAKIAVHDTATATNTALQIAKNAIATALSMVTAAAASDHIDYQSEYYDHIDDTNLRDYMTQELNIAIDELITATEDHRDSGDHDDSSAILAERNLVNCSYDYHIVHKDQIVAASWDSNEPTCTDCWDSDNPISAELEAIYELSAKLNADSDKTGGPEVCTII